ncbi:MAG: RraA family protein [Pirellulales bacterium]
MVEKQPGEFTLEMMRTSLYSAVVCDALDGLGYRNQSPRVPLAALTSDRVLVGRCKTTLWGEVFHTEENPYELELKAVDGCMSDDVLICAAGGSRRSGVWGELLSTAARNRGCVGAIVDGAVRDVVKMRRMDFPVFARSTCVYDSAHRQRVVAIDVAVEIDGVAFTPGDLVIADVDGVVVVPRQVEQQAVARAWEKVHAEDTVREAIAQGMKAGEAYRKYGVL